MQNGEKILREAGHLGFERVVLPIRNAERLKKTLASINKERQEKGLQPLKMVGIKNISEVAESVLAPGRRSAAAGAQGIPVKQFQINIKSGCMKHPLLYCHFEKLRAIVILISFQRTL